MHKKLNTCYKIFLFSVLLLQQRNIIAQQLWTNVDTVYGSLPKGFHIFRTTDSLDGKPFIAFYAIADLKSKKQIFISDTTYQRRFTPTQFFKKNNHPLLVVNTTFFSFASNLNLNLVIKNGALVSFNTPSIPLKGKDTFMYSHPFGSAIGIDRKRRADVAWTFTDLLNKTAYAIQNPVIAVKDSISLFTYSSAQLYSAKEVGGSFLGPEVKKTALKKWKMQTAVGGGPVLVQNALIKITNNEEYKFAGKAINDLHPRTLMGYTKDNKLIIMVIEGRNPGIAHGSSLLQAAKLMIDLGCIEALNMDGGGSSCMLINGKETIKPSDTGLQRPVPAVFIIQQKMK